MRECDRFPYGSRQRALCSGQGDLRTVNKFRAAYGLAPLAGDISSDPPLENRTAEPSRAVLHTPRLAAGQRSRGCCGGNRTHVAAQQYSLNGWGPGSQLVRHYESLGVPECEDCLRMAARMDAWGVRGCRERLFAIVDDMLPRAKAMLLDMGQLSLDDAAIREGIRQDVERAIDAAEKHQNDRSEPEFYYETHPAEAPRVRESVHFVTTLTDEFSAGLVCLLKSLNDRSRIDYRMTVVYLESIAAKNRSAIESQAAVDWIDRRELAETPKLRTSMPRLAPNFNKLLMWHLPFNEELVFIDSDMLCVDSLEQLLEWRPLTVVRNFVRYENRRRGEAAYKVASRPIWNSGVFCFRPDAGHAEAIYRLASEYKTTRLGDQEILNDYWNANHPGEVKYADYAFNYRMYLHTRTHVRLLHFAHQEKPWRDRPKHGYQREAFALWNGVVSGKPDYDRFLNSVTKGGTHAD